MSDSARDSAARQPDTGSFVSAEPRYPSLAELTRSLLERPHGVLGTLQQDGYPYTSLVELAPLDGGDLFTLLSDLAQHSKHLRRDSRASLLLAEGGEAPLTRPRSSLKGTLVPFETDPALYLKRHPEAKRYLALADFHFYRFKLDKAYTVAGFGRMGWLSAEAVAAAEPDPLLGVAPGAVAHMNEDHRANLVDYARAFLGLDWAMTAEMLSLDRYGFDIRVTDSEKKETHRISFSEPLADPRDLRRLMVDLANEARQRLGVARG